MNTWKLAGLVALFGAIGVLARFMTVQLTLKHFPSFPAGTLFVNIAGSFVVGCAFAYFAMRSDLPQLWKIVLVSGFLGGFTTFSSFSLELLEFYRDGRILSFLAYGIGSPVLGVLAAVSGALLTDKLI